MTFDDEIAAYRARHPEPEGVEIIFPDIGGIWRGKRHPWRGLEKLGTAGIAFPLSSLILDARGETPHEILEPPLGGDPDGMFFPVPGLLQPIPWADRPMAQCVVRATGADGAPWFGDPRSVLDRVTARFAEQGLTPVVAIEQEFYLVDPSEDPPRPPRLPGAPAEGAQCYSMDALYDGEDFIRDLERMCAAQDIPLTSVLCEYGDGQYEANLGHVPDAARACDDAMRLKRAVKALARERGLIGSYMARPYTEGTGSGTHVHVSLLDENGANIFAGSEGTARLRHAAGGLLATMAEGMSIFAPNANSYRRFQPGNFAPCGPNWGANHRSVAVREIARGAPDARLEHRVAGADASPHLTAAAVLAGMHHGLTQAIEPVPPIETGQRAGEAPPNPLRWREALLALEDAAVLPGYFGADFVEVYLRTRHAEERAFHAEVSDRDRGWYMRAL